MIYFVPGKVNKSLIPTRLKYIRLISLNVKLRVDIARYLIETFPSITLCLR